MVFVSVPGGTSITAFDHNKQLVHSMWPKECLHTAVWPQGTVVWWDDATLGMKLKAERVLVPSSMTNQVCHCKMVFRWPVPNPVNQHICCRAPWPSGHSTILAERAQHNCSSVTLRASEPRCARGPTIVPRVVA